MIGDLRRVDPVERQDDSKVRMRFWNEIEGAHVVTTPIRVDKRDSRTGRSTDHVAPNSVHPPDFRLCNSPPPSDP